MSDYTSYLIPHQVLSVYHMNRCSHHAYSGESDHQEWFPLPSELEKVNIVQLDESLDYSKIEKKNANGDVKKHNHGRFQ